MYKVKSLDEFVNEMAKPTSEIKAKAWFHGTNEDAGVKITKDGYLKPSENVTTKSRGYMTPVHNKTYLTSSIIEAIKYAYFRSKDGEHPYLIVINGKDLKDVNPDEDILADLLQTDDTILGFEWLLDLAKRVDFKLYDKFDKMGDYSYSVKLAKKILKWGIPDFRKIELINKGLKLSHTGTIKVNEIWKLPVKDTQSFGYKGFDEKMNYRKTGEKIK